ncbi:MAG: type II secretion system F family protein [Desulfobacterota bacterium]|nr:type II secretion system F family protein [Thermodesulfobacteriota bacterium]
MAEFLYKATTLSGQTVEGSMEGKDEASIVQGLHRLGYIPIRIELAEKRESRLGIFARLPKRVGLGDLLVFTQELSTLIQAGLPMDRSLRILISLTENRRLKEVVLDILRRVEGGSSLAEALNAHPKIFSKLYVNMVKAGEAGGFLETILSRLVHYLQHVKEIRDSLLSVMIYPLLLTAVSGLSIALLVTFVVPRFAKIFSDMGQAIPLPTQVVLWISQSVRDYWWLGMGALLLVLLFFKAYLQDEERRFRWDRFKLRWVLVGELLRKVEVARFSRTLGTLLHGGVSILPALNLVREISQNRVMSRAIGLLHDRLREGKSLSKSLEETAIFPPLAVQMVGVGEESGRLDEMLIRIAEVFEEDFQRGMRRLISLLEPVVILIMGGVVGFIVISMLLAIFSIHEIPF